ncbi:MAG: signal peptidase I, partial [Gemmatimonadetes bacterium]|nr:signal peptidase I [Gemmatimonadota bacterium]
MFGKKSPGPGAKGAAKTESRESFRTIFWALVIAIVIRTFFVQAFRIPSGSMEDTLLIGDFLLVDKITFGARVP